MTLTQSEIDEISDKIAYYEMLQGLEYNQEREAEIKALKEKIGDTEN